jgi:uncharacterized membrane protein YbhN (UPF0104 family)
MESEGNPSFNRRWMRWAGTALATGLFIWLLYRQDWRATWVNLSRLPPGLVPLALSFYYAGMLANALRWCILLKTQVASIPFSEVIKIVFAGAFVSNFLPSTIGGDAVRIVSVRRFILDWEVSVASVVIDRLLNVLAMLVTLPFTWLTFGAKILSILKLASAVGVGFAAQVSVQTPEKSGGWKASLKRIRDALILWKDHPWQLALAFVIAWLSILAIFCGVWVVARGLGIEVALYQVMGINVITYLLTLLPISVNGYGVREVAMTALYIQLGATLEQASTLALLTRCFMLLETLPGAIWLSQILPDKNAINNSKFAKAGPLDPPGSS